MATYTPPFGCEIDVRRAGGPVSSPRAGNLRGTAQERRRERTQGASAPHAFLAVLCAPSLTTDRVRPLPEPVTQRTLAAHDDRSTSGRATCGSSTTLSRARADEGTRAPFFPCSYLYLSILTITCSTTRLFLARYARYARRSPSVNPPLAAASSNLPIRSHPFTGWTSLITLSKSYSFRARTFRRSCRV